MLAEDVTITKSATNVDRHVGARIRMQRLLLKMSQEKLAGAIGLTFQQVQKYEKGTNRVGASRLQQIAGVLGVQVDFFFAGAPALEVPSGTVLLTTDMDLLTGEGLKLLQAFHTISDGKVRRRLLMLVNTLAGAEPDGEHPLPVAAQGEAVSLRTH